MLLFKKKYHLKSDEELMVLLRAGHQSAFGELYERYATRIHRYFYRMLRQDEELARDHTQDLFLHILERPHLFDTNRQFSTWLYSVASNRCKNVYRTWSRRQPTVNLEENTLDERASDPLDQIDQELFDTALLSALDDLPDHQRECFVLRYQEELSIKEIGAIIACPEGTVKSRLHYALRQLAQDLRPFNPKSSNHEKRKQ